MLHVVSTLPCIVQAGYGGVPSEILIHVANRVPLRSRKLTGICRKGRIWLLHAQVHSRRLHQFSVAVQNSMKAFSEFQKHSN